MKEQGARDMCGTILTVTRNRITESGMTSEEAQNVIMLRYFNTFPLETLQSRVADIEKGIGYFRKKDKNLLLRVEHCIKQKIEEKEAT